MIWCWMAGEIFLFSTVVALVRRFNGFFRMCVMRFVLFVLFYTLQASAAPICPDIPSAKHITGSAVFVTMTSRACAADLLISSITHEA